MKGWWIFAGTAAVSILSKHVITWRGHHFFNPSNFGLVLCFVLLGATRADPLAFWWGPMSPWMALALVIILVGAFAILSRLHLLAIAVTFWITFAIGIAVIAAAGHQMTARWHLGPITGFEFWRVVVLSPEVMVFLFFMITDPKTTPKSRVGRRVYALSVALLAVLLIAPQVTEFWTKVALLGALWIVCAARPVVDVLAPRLQPAFARPRRLPARRRRARRRGRVRRRARARRHSRRVPRRPSRGPPLRPGRLPQLTVLPSKGVATQIDPTLARQIAADLVSDLRIEADALRTRDKARAARAAGGTRLQGLWAQIGAAGTSAIIVPQRHVDKLQLELEAAVGQEPPIVVATATGTERLVTYHGTPAAVSFTGNDDAVHPNARAPARRRRATSSSARAAARPRRSHPARRRSSSPPASAARASQNVAPAVGIDFQQNAFRTHGDDGRDRDDGRRRLLGRHRQRRLARPVRRQLLRGRRPPLLAAARRHAAQRALPQRQGAVHRRQPLVGGGRRRSAATAASRATSTATASPTSTSPRPGNDALLWNDGKGHFSEGARAAGITAWGWHTGAAVARRERRRAARHLRLGLRRRERSRPSDAGFPNNYQGVRDLLYLNDRQRRATATRGSGRSARGCASTAARPSTGSAPCSPT